MQKWLTNEDKLRQTLQENGESAIQNAPTKVLGLYWNTEEDTFHVSLEPLLDIVKNEKPTKRTVLQATPRIFDPLGLLSPFTIRAKIIFQDIWKQGIDWDGSLPKALEDEWMKLTGEVEDIKDLTLKRSSLIKINTDEAHFELDVFSDASPQAYGVVTYLRVEDRSGIAYVQQLLAKARVAPIMRLTLPCLELVGACLCARIATFLRETLPKCDEYFCWTDSNICLCWIRSSPTKWKAFVYNRVMETQERTDPSRWSHCAGKVNTADFLTRALDKSSAIRDLHPFVDNKGMMIKTRLDNVEASEKVKCPVLLPADHRCTHLIVESEHRRLLHSGVGVTLTELREKFWIVRGRQCSLLDFSLVTLLTSCLQH
ncbi:uncharacterized protein LOC125759991 [Rhipicephalus sanguineus]|uniref:uncharacterized protein LOC125759991 n=1 Tax=Rhipicephalus sanguineus TaxID=34632 RepID=UPI0020C1DAFD|nr:uncharacterized protein LOC125759991 [Rhipicephalus sanguineus]